MKPKANRTHGERRLIFADSDEVKDNGFAVMLPLYDGRDINKIIKAIKKCFPHTMACDGTLMVTTQNYNELVELINK
jgi:hypothetical protein